MKVAIIGTGCRAQTLYIPVIQKLPFLELKGICGSNYEKTISIAKQLGTLAYKSIEDVMNDKHVDFIIVCVRWTENSTIYKLIAQSDKPALLETPLGHNIKAISESFTALSTRKAYTEIAEQYHLRPIEFLKRALIETGIFGEIFYAFNDGVGHEYHGISLIRSYLGFNQTLKKAYAMQRDVPCFDHKLHEGIFFDGERIQHSILEFDSGAQASFHWSWLNYSSPIRARRLAGFHGTRGAAWGEECLAFKDKENLPEYIRFDRRTRVIDGIEVITEVLAHFDEKVIAKWTNPYPKAILNEDQIVAVTFINSVINGMKDMQIPLYPPSRAYEDHKMVEAIIHSALIKADADL